MIIIYLTLEGLVMNYVFFKCARLVFYFLKRDGCVRLFLFPYTLLGTLLLITNLVLCFIPSIHYSAEIGDRSFQWWILRIYMFIYAFINFLLSWGLVRATENWSTKTTETYASTFLRMRNRQLRLVIFLFLVFGIFNLILFIVGHVALDIDTVECDNYIVPVNNAAGVFLLCRTIANMFPTWYFYIIFYRIPSYHNLLVKRLQGQGKIRLDSVDGAADSTVEDELDIISDLRKMSTSISSQGKTLGSSTGITMTSINRSTSGEALEEDPSPHRKTGKPKILFNSRVDRSSFI